VEVIGAGFADAFRDAKAAPLPLQASVDEPAQDAGPLLFELLGKVRVPVFLWDGDDEGDEQEAGADGFVVTLPPTGSRS
jgi:hypothetical protein